MTKTSVVILNYNGENYLKTFLPSVILHSDDAEIIVADNNSTDHSIQLLTDHFPSVKQIILEKNYGFADGYNRAIEKIESEYIVLLNSDVEVTYGWLTPLIHFLDENPEYAACQPKIKDQLNRNRFEYAGACGGFIDALGYPFCRGRLFNTIEEDIGQYDESVDIFWSSGACMIIRSDVFKKVGGLDADFFAHMEEIDLCWRIWSLGFKIRVIPTSSVFHVGGGTLAKSKPLKTFLNFRNGLLMIIKNLPRNELVIKLPIRIVLDWLAAIKFLFEGKWKHTFSVLKAHLTIVFSIRRTLKKRTIVSKPYWKELLIWEYYLKGNKRFTDLQ